MAIAAEITNMTHGGDRKSKGTNALCSAPAVSREAAAALMDISVRGVGARARTYYGAQARDSAS
jgi:hypothetical protein